MLGPAHPYRGGLAAFNERLACELAKNHEVAVFTFTLQYPDFLFPGKSQYTDGPAPGLDIKRTLSSVNPISWRKTATAINDFRAELLIIGFWLPFMGPAFGSVAKWVRCPVVAVVHNIIPHESRPGDRLLSGYFARNCDAFVSLTASVQRDLTKFVGAKPSVVSPHPIYDHFGPITAPAAAQKNLGLDPDGEYLLFFGLVRDYKGLDLLLGAMSDARIAERGTKLIVAGEFYSGRAEYDAIITELGLQNTVELHDRFIPDDRVADYFNATELLVQPYKTATQSGVTPVAYHFELPMVVTDVGGLAAMCPDGEVGYVVAPTATAIADGIWHYLTATDRAAMRRNIREEKAKYDWSVMVATIEKLLPGLT